MNLTILSGVVSKPKSVATAKSHRTSFTLTTSMEKVYNGKSTTYRDNHTVVVWGPAAEVLGTKLQDGSLVLVMGELHYRKFKPEGEPERWITEVVVPTSGKVEIVGGCDQATESDEIPL